MTCSCFGALGGIFLASATGGVQLDLGAGNILLFSVAAAVIGGTSLFGGRGKARDAIIGALVIVIIPNGIGLKPSLPTQYNNIITGMPCCCSRPVSTPCRAAAPRPAADRFHRPPVGGPSMSEPIITWGDWDAATATIRIRCSSRREPSVRFGRSGWPTVTTRGSSSGHEAAHQALKDVRLSKDIVAALDEDPDVVDPGLPGPAPRRAT